MKTMRYLPFYSLLLVISGCDLMQTNKAVSQAKSDMAAIKRRAEKKAEKYKESMVIPKIDPYEEYKISSNLEDPFTTLSFAYSQDNDEDSEEKLVDCSEGATGCGNAPDTSRKKSFLEQYELSSLAYVGSMDKKNKKAKVGLVRTPDVGVVQIKAGQYIGKNHGLVLRVMPRALIISEKVKQGTIWQDRRRNLLISK